MTLIKLDIEGDKETIEALAKFPEELEQAAQGAGKEGIMEIRVTPGVQTYPPPTGANSPPFPYYERGRGTWTSPGNNTNSSEQYGKRWTEPVGEGYTTTSRNTASYAKYLVSDEDQALHMWNIGWNRLGDVAEEKKPKLIAILTAWIDRAIAKLGLGK